MTIGRPIVQPSWAWARAAAAAATLAVVAWRLGAGPFRDGVRAVDGTTLAAAAAIGALTTVCCAWRWTIVARGLGVHLSLPAAIAAYYRSMFLNLTLPGGVVGDVHRGVSHGRDVRDVGRGLRAVAWERSFGQLVQIVLTVAVLFALPSPVQSWMPLAAAGLVAIAVGVVALNRVLPGIAGWGPREGATAWVFGAAGLGADTGVATAVVYGVVVLVASLPGALVLVAAWLRHAGPLVGRQDGTVDA